MRLICPQCGNAIAASSVNVATDLAKCQSCGELFKASGLVADVDLESDLGPPSGSRIAFTARADGSGEFDVPRAGFALGDVPILIFATVWTGGIAAWTLLASGMILGGGGAGLAALCPVLFSIPFWAIGVTMWVALINGIMERQKIELTREEITIRKLRPIRPREIVIAYSEIESIAVESVMPREPFSMVKNARQFHKFSGAFGGIPMPCVAHGTKKTHFAEQVSEAEMKWLVKVIKAVVYKLSGEKV